MRVLVGLHRLSQSGWHYLTCSFYLFIPDKYPCAYCVWVISIILYFHSVAFFYTEHYHLDLLYGFIITVSALFVSIMLTYLTKRGLEKMSKLFFLLIQAC